MTPGQVVLTYLLGSYPMNVFLLWLVTKHKDVGKVPDDGVAAMFWLSPIMIVGTIFVFIYVIGELITRVIKYILR